MKRFALKIGVFLLGVFSLAMPSFAQNHDMTTSDRVDDLANQVDQAIAEGNVEQAILFGIEAVNLSLLAEASVSAHAMLSLSQAYFQKESYIDALDYSVQALTLLENHPERGLLANALLQTGNICYQWGVYEKAADYLEKSQAIYEQIGGTDCWLAAYEKQFVDEDAPKEPCWQKAAFSLSKVYAAMGNMEKAESKLKLLLASAHTTHNDALRENSLSALARLARQEGKYQKGLDYLNELGEGEENIMAPEGFIGHQSFFRLYGQDYAFMLRRLGKYNEAVYVLQSALKAWTRMGNAGFPSLHAELGAAYTHLRLHEAATKSYQAALDIYGNQKEKEGVASVCSYLGANEYVQGKHNMAIHWLELSVQAASDPKLNTQLSDSYLLLSEVYSTIGDFKHSQEAYRKHVEAKQAIVADKQILANELQRRNLSAQERETQSRLLVADKDKQLMQLRQERLEAEKKVRELELVTRQKDLQTERLRNEELQKDRATQALRITQQQLDAARRDREIADLEREREMQQFTLMQKDFEEKVQKNEVDRLSQENALLEQSQQLQDAKFAEEHARQRYFYLVIGFITLMLLIAIAAFLWARKQQRRIQTQNAQITDQNHALEAQKDALESQQIIIKEKNEELMSSQEELRQNAEELMATNEQANQTLFALQAQKKLVDKKNADIMASINYAKRIQQAILPDLRVVQRYIPESFVFYQPKDIVSGDFYWVHQAGSKTFIAAVDCTGHGVPGAFMSLIGSSLLREFVVDKKEEDPGRILDLMHIGVVEGLRKKETDSKDGMDASICVIDREAKTLKFSGANNPSVYIQNGELHEIKADKFAIGGAKDLYEEHFETHTISIEGPTTVYLFSDGLQDQFGGPDGRKFMRKRLKEVLSQIHQLPMNEQLERMVTEYNDWTQGQYKQTDDILLIGFEV